MIYRHYSVFLKLLWASVKIHTEKQSDIESLAHLCHPKPALKSHASLYKLKPGLSFSPSMPFESPARLSQPMQAFLISSPPSHSAQPSLSHFQPAWPSARTHACHYDTKPAHPLVQLLIFVLIFSIQLIFTFRRNICFRMIQVKE